MGCRIQGTIHFMCHPKGSGSGGSRPVFANVPSRLWRRYGLPMVRNHPFLPLGIKVGNGVAVIVKVKVALASANGRYDKELALGVVAARAADLRAKRALYKNTSTTPHSQRDIAWVPSIKGRRTLGSRLLIPLCSLATARSLRHNHAPCRGSQSIGSASGLCVSAKG